MKKLFSLFAAVLFAGSMMAASLLSIDFTQGQGEWTIDNVLLPEGTEFVWAQTSNYGMKATAYFDNTNHESEAWLVSPAIDLSEVDAAKVVFSHARKFGNLDQLSVRAKAGDGEWAVLEVSAWPDGSNWNFIDAEADIAAFAGKADVKIAFVYTSSSSAAATWEIKTVDVTDDGGVTPPDPEVTPEVPEGVLTCDAAAELAAGYDEPTAEQKEVEVGDVVIRGFVTFCYDAKDGQQSAWLADLKSAKSGVVQAYYANVIEPVAKGDYVEVSGKLVKYFKAGKEGKADEVILEVKSGDMKVVEPLAVENVVLTEKAKKVMVDGVMYIVRDNKMFDVRGTQVR